LHLADGATATLPVNKLLLRFISVPGGSVFVCFGSLIQDSIKTICKSSFFYRKRNKKLNYNPRAQNFLEAIVYLIKNIAVAIH